MKQSYIFMGLGLTRVQVFRSMIDMGMPGLRGSWLERQLNI